MCAASLIYVDSIVIYKTETSSCIRIRVSEGAITKKQQGRECLDSVPEGEKKRVVLGGLGLVLMIIALEG